MSLPSGYTQVAYIQFTGTQWIDTGLKLPSSYKIELGLTPMASKGVICGVQWSSPKFELCVWENQMGICTADAQFTTHTITPGSGYYDLVCDNNSFTINGVKETKTVTGSNSIAYNLLIGAHGSGEIANYHGQMKLYYFRLYNNSSLVRDFVPCINSLGTAGLYDLANGVFYGNDGTGAFTAGHEVYEPIHPLPAKYRLTDYIEGSNAYIDTGYKPNNNTRLEVTYYAYGSASAIAACDTAWKNNGFGIWQTAAEYGSNVASSLGTVKNETVEASLENGVFTRNGTTYTITTSTFQTAYNMYLFALNRAGSPQEIASKLRMYSCRLYENGTTVRDFIPCINPSGESGMWETVNGVFYGNIGSGSFSPGTVFIMTPDPPENLTADSAAGTNTLAWDESANADGYRIYENGVLIGDTTETLLTAASESYSVKIYSVTAYNSDGESDPAMIRVYTSGSRDVLDDLITDRTLADVTGRTKKGAYNASDVNRVCDAAQRVKMLLSPLGYSTADVSDYRWSSNEVPTAEEMTAYYRSAAGQDVLNYAAAKEKLPGSVKNLDYTGANAIEMMLRLTGRAAERIPEGYIYSGEIYGGDG